jgi:hypothetical protein
VPGQELDGRTGADILALLDTAAARGGWLVLAGHEIGESGNQTSRVDTIDTILARATARDGGIWVAPVGEVAAHLMSMRSRGADR